MPHPLQPIFDRGVDPRISPSLGFELREAAAAGDIAAVRAFVEHVPGLDLSPAVLGALAHPPVLEYLLSRGAGLEGRDYDGKTPLMLAIGRREAKLVGQLISAGARVDAKDDKGNTPTSLAASGMPALLVRMIEAGADPNAGAPLALEVAGRDVIPTLIQLGADPSRIDSKGRMLFHAWCESDPDLAALALLEAPASLHARLLGPGPTGCTAWMHAAWAGRTVEGVDPIGDDEARFRFLSAARDGRHVAETVPLDCRTPGGETALHLLAKKGAWDAVEHLLDLGADPWAYPWFVAKVAEERNRGRLRAEAPEVAPAPAPDLLDRLLAPRREAFLETGRRWPDGWPLLYVARRTLNDRALYAEVLDAGAAPDQPGAAYTELYWQAKSDPEMVARLLQAGADPDGARGGSPIGAALDNGQATTLLLLRRAGARLPADAFKKSVGALRIDLADLTVESGFDVVTFLMLIGAGASPDHCEADGQQLMTMPTYKLVTPVLEALFTVHLLAAAVEDAGPDADADRVLDALAIRARGGAPDRSPQATWDGSTVVRLWAREGREDLVAGLLARGLPARPTFGPPHIATEPAAAAARSGHLRIVERLLEAGGDRGVTLLAALEAGKTEIASALLARGGRLDADLRTTLSLLTAAARSGDAGTLRLLLDAGLDPAEARAGVYGFSPLHDAASGEVAVLLLDRGALLEPRSPDGATPLWRAVAEGRRDVVTALLRRGADRSITTRRGGLIDAALRDADVRMLALLAMEGFTLTEAQRAALEAKAPGVAAWLWPTPAHSAVERAVGRWAVALRARGLDLRPLTLDDPFPAAWRRVAAVGGAVHGLDWPLPGLSLRHGLCEEHLYETDDGQEILDSGGWAVGYAEGLGDTLVLRGDSDDPTLFVHSHTTNTERAVGPLSAFLDTLSDRVERGEMPELSA